ncbi:MAG TPA: lysylphosphatidylglycerol synthase transmembrane domain-containing protein, partial [Ktedonobacterales bacterium]
APLDAQILAFALSEVTKALPIGNYFQNYVLQQAEGADIGLTSAATTLFILEEVVVSLAGVVILGLGGWTEWLRPLILIGVAIAAAVIWLFVRFHHPGRRPEWVSRHTTLQTIADELGRFREGAVDLLHPGALAVTLACSATYLVIGGAALYVVVEGLGISGATFTEALAVYFFSLAIALMLPIPVDFGVIEISGVGAFAAIGVTRDAAIGAVLVNRILSILASIAIAAVVVLILHKEVAELVRYISKKPSGDERDGARDPHNRDGHGRDHSSQADAPPTSRDAAADATPRDRLHDSQPNSAFRQVAEAQAEREGAARWISRRRARRMLNARAGPAWLRCASAHARSV